MFPYLKQEISFYRVLKFVLELQALERVINLPLRRSARYTTANNRNMNRITIYSVFLTGNNKCATQLRISASAQTDHRIVFRGLDGI